jgi:DtxR family Mn-dependent transcriptional regulator
MERDGLLTVQGDRHLELTSHGRVLATRVMRKHRLAECMLVDVIGLDWEDVHPEACRWEHVMSEEVERRLLEILHHPTTSPYGNPIPGLEELGEPFAAGADETLATLVDVAGAESRRVSVRRIGEPLQTDAALMSRLRRAGVRPGESVAVRTSSGGLLVGSMSEYIEVDAGTGSHIFVSAVSP